MMRREIVIDECRNESARLGRPRTADRRGDCRGAVKISPVGPKSLRVRFITDLYRAYLLHPGSLKLARARDAGDARWKKTKHSIVSVLSW